MFFILYGDSYLFISATACVMVSQRNLMEVDKKNEKFFLSILGLILYQLWNKQIYENP